MGPRKQTPIPALDVPDFLRKLELPDTLSLLNLLGSLPTASPAESESPSAADYPWSMSGPSKVEGEFSLIAQNLSDFFKTSRDDLQSLGTFKTQLGTFPFSPKFDPLPFEYRGGTIHFKLFEDHLTGNLFLDSSRRGAEVKLKGGLSIRGEYSSSRNWSVFLQFTIGKQSPSVSDSLKDTGLASPLLRLLGIDNKIEQQQRQYPRDYPNFMRW